MDSSLLNTLAEYPWIQQKQTVKLFYKTFDTKICIELPKESLFSGIVFKIRLIIEKQFTDQIRTRCESKHLNIFLNSKSTNIKSILEFLKTITLTINNTSIDRYITEIYSDSVGLEKRQQLSPTIKKQGFKYKLLIKTGRSDSEIKSRLLNIIKQNAQNFKVPKSTDKWLNNNRFIGDWEQKYLYINDESVLTFINLSCDQLVDKVYEII